MRTVIHFLLPATALIALALPGLAAAQDQGQVQPAPRSGAEVRVDTPQPEVDVRQRAPEVQVEQRAPDVEVRQAEPDVQVRQGQPQVDVRQAQPQVQVQPPQQPGEASIDRPNEAQVQVRQAEPVIRVEVAEPQVQVEQVQQQPKVDIVRMSRREAQMEDAGFGRERLVGLNVVGGDGDDVGKVDDVILGKDGRRIERVVVRMGGGLFGGEERLVAVPWNQVEVNTREERIELPMTEDQLKRAQAFQYTGQETRLSQQAKAQQSGDGQKKQEGQKKQDG